MIDRAGKRPSLTYKSVLGVIFASIALGIGIFAVWSETRFRPEIGQPGKDVIWAPTPDRLVEAMLRMAAVKPGETVVDLGSGDGRIPIAAARDFGANARGIEFNPDMVTVSRRLAREAGIGDRARFVQGDIFVEDFSDADVVTMYLLPSLNLKLRPTLLRMRPGTRIVSHAFDLGDWEPDRETAIGPARAFLWIVPADASGAWRVRLPNREAVDLQIEQSYQMLSGEARLGDVVAPIEGRMTGADLVLRIKDPRGAALQIQAAVAGEAMNGQILEGEAASALSIERLSGPAH